MNRCTARSSFIALFIIIMWEKVEMLQEKVHKDFVTLLIKSSRESKPNENDIICNPNQPPSTIPPCTHTHTNTLALLNPFFSKARSFCIIFFLRQSKARAKKKNNKTTKHHARNQHANN